MDLFRRAETAASAVRNEFAPDALPVDVTKIAWGMGVDQIVFGPIGTDGRLERTRDSAKIRVQVRANPRRKRFTIAHELGHLWLQRERESAPRPAEHHLEERFCNAFAAALLMPEEWIGKEARAHQPCLESLHAIAAQGDVSLSACLLRLHRFPDWRLSLLHWSWDSGDWRLWSVSGAPSDYRRQISSLKDTRKAISIVSRCKVEEPMSIKLCLRLGDKEVDVDAELRVSKRHALALADLKAARPRSGDRGTTPDA